MSTSVILEWLGQYIMLRRYLLFVSNEFYYRFVNVKQERRYEGEGSIGTIDVLTIFIFS